MKFMKKIKETLSLAFSFAGCFLGAGYVSGKELWQYFGSYGKAGTAGAVISILVLGTVCGLLMTLSRDTGIKNMSEILIRWDFPALRSFAGLLMIVLVFGIVCIMTAGIGAMLRQYFNIPELLGNLAAITVIAAIAWFGIGGMVRMFSFSVPVLVLATVIISIAAIGRSEVKELVFLPEQTNPLLGNWLMASINYASLNYVASIAILVPLASTYTNKKTIAAGIVIGCIFLLAIALCIICAIVFLPASVEKELPMLFIAEKMGSITNFVGFRISLITPTAHIE